MVALVGSQAFAGTGSGGGVLAEVAMVSNAVLFRGSVGNTLIFDQAFIDTDNVLQVKTWELPKSKSALLKPEILKALLESKHSGQWRVPEVKY